MAGVDWPVPVTVEVVDEIAADLIHHLDNACVQRSSAGLRPSQ
ncbi:hypothetical protein [Streptomyces abikoensis]